MLRTVAARNCSGAWPLVSTIWRSASGRDLLAQDWPEGEEEALVAGQPADRRRRLAVQRRMIGLIGRAEAGDIGDILAQRQLAVHVQAGKRLILVELRGQRVRLLPGNA